MEDETKASNSQSQISNIQSETVMNLINKRFMVTGGEGFLGHYLIAELKQQGAQHIFVPRHQDYDLTKIVDASCAYKEGRPNIVIHLAAAEVR